jgi:hypothetical protein
LIYKTSIDFLKTDDFIMTLKLRIQTNEVWLYRLKMDSFRFIDEVSILITDQISITLSDDLRRSQNFVFRLIRNGFISVCNTLYSLNLHRF